MKLKLFKNNTENRVLVNYKIDFKNNTENRSVVISEKIRTMILSLKIKNNFTFDVDICYK